MSMSTPKSPADAQVVGLCVGAVKSEPLRLVDEVRAVAGHGIEGDRTFRREGEPTDKDSPSRELTLIESEAVEAARREYGIELEPIEARRTVVTRGVALNHLVGRRFRVGEATLQGIRLCEPCAHLESLTRPGVRKSLIHRGGLRAQILEGGTIRLGDPIVPLAPGAPPNNPTSGTTGII
jgi:MOSC domain-containing protein YiiM